MALTATIDATGVTVPPYSETLTGLVDLFKGIYGADAYLAADSQDFQFLSILALAISDTNQLVAAVYNSFSPATATGAGLSSNVKINGIARLIAARGSVSLNVVGQAGTVISNGIAQDTLGNKWALPVSVTIPLSGTITVTATAVDVGATPAAVNTVTMIATPTRGWQSITNPTAATPGAPIEQDSTLRARQAVSTGLPALSVLTSIYAAVANITGVKRLAVYENDTGTTNANGQPKNSVYVVTDGGDAQTIGNTIASKKTPGTGTYGNTSVTTTDSKGIQNVIKFSTLTQVPITVQIAVTALTGYVATTGVSIAAAVQAYIAALDIGEDVEVKELYTPANLGNDPALRKTFKVTSIKISRGGATPVEADIVIAYDEGATCIASNVTTTVTT